MPELGEPSTLRSGGAVPRDCPRCGGVLGEPVSGDVHCYVDCTKCGGRFELNDPELAHAGPDR